MRFVKIGCFIASLLFVMLIKAQDTEVFKLTANDVEHFIKHFPGLKSDLEKFGAKYDSESGDFTLPEGVKALSDFNHIIVKHGYKDYADLFQKVGAITIAYGVIVAEEEMKNAEIELKAQIAAIDKNDALSADQKQMMKAQMEASLTVMKTYSNAYASSANVTVVNQYIEKLNVVFERDVETD